MAHIKYVLTILGLTIVLISSCNYGYIDQEFEGYFYETKWIYDFRLDGTYELSSYGHLGVEGVFDSGKYNIVECTIDLFCYENQ